MVNLKPNHQLGIKNGKTTLNRFATKTLHLNFMDVFMPQGY